MGGAGGGGGFGGQVGGQIGGQVGGGADGLHRQHLEQQGAVGGGEAEALQMHSLECRLHFGQSAKADLERLMRAVVTQVGAGFGADGFRGHALGGHFGAGEGLQGGEAGLGLCNIS